jgi:hypothetical protein
VRVEEKMWVLILAIEMLYCHKSVCWNGQMEDKRNGGDLDSRTIGFSHREWSSQINGWCDFILYTMTLLVICTIKALFILNYPNSMNISKSLLYESIQT